LLLNAEGTRFTPKKHAASIEFAKQRGMNELKYHLIPRSKGFTTSLPHLKKDGKCKAIMDVELAFNESDAVSLLFIIIWKAQTHTHTYIK
jgi:lysophosphatidic acid acyltransferase / lysophosphatidylinositol acyltransferase